MDGMHVSRLKRGVNAWNNWRIEYPSTCPDLTDLVLWIMVEESMPGRWFKLPYRIFKLADFLAYKKTSMSDITEASAISDSFRSGPPLVEVSLSGINLDNVHLCNAELCLVDLSYASCCEANLSGVDLTYANLIGIKIWKTNADYSILALADLRNATISSTQMASAKMYKAIFDSAEISSSILECADLTSVLARNSRLSNVDGDSVFAEDADFTASTISNSSFKDATLRRVKFKRTMFSEVSFANASLSDVDFSNSDLSNIDFSHAELIRADFQQARLRDCIFEDSIMLNSASFVMTDLERANLHGVNLSGANMRSANLRGANLTHACLAEVDLSSADLQGADLSYSNLSNSCLRSANLTEARLNHSNLSGADAIKADFSRAELTNADLRNIMLASLTGQSANVSQANFSGAFLTERRGSLIGRSLLELASAEGLVTAKFDSPDFLPKYITAVFEYIHQEGTEEQALYPKFVNSILNRIKIIRNLYDSGEPSAELILAVKTITTELISYISKHPRAIYSISPRQFEELIAEILASFGWRIQLTSTTRDGGHDIFAISQDNSSLSSAWVIECKRYAPQHKVDVSIARTLYGVMTDIRANCALLATTSSFTADTVKFAGRHYGFELRDYQAILEWINTYKPNPKGRLYIKDNILTFEDLKKISN